MFLNSLQKYNKDRTCGKNEQCTAYREFYNTHYVLRLIEEWKINLDNIYLIGAVLIDLSKAFDYIHYDLVIVKLRADGFYKNMLCCIYQYLKIRKQDVSENNI